MDVILVTEKGKGLRFHESKVRLMGRTARGVKAMRIAKDDRLTSVDVAEESDYLLIAGEKGIGKRTKVSEIPRHGRATGGVMVTNKRMLDVTGKIVSACVLKEDFDLTMMTATGNVIRMKGSLIPVMGRTARGVRLIKLDEGDLLVAVTANDPADMIIPPEQTMNGADAYAALPEDDLEAYEEAPDDDEEADDIDDVDEAEDEE
jgi:DNA gyrase subunit A